MAGATATAAPPPTSPLFQTSPLTATQGLTPGRPLAILTAPPLNPANYADTFVQAIRSTTAAAGLIFFVLGSVIFFGVAGLVAGMAFRWGERHRYELYRIEEDETDTAGTTPPTDGNDRWPASLT